MSRRNSRSKRCRRMLCLGDSYTVGHGVAPSEAWPVQWSRRIDKEESSESAITTVARTGWTSSDLLQALACEERHAGYEVATILIGVNDQFDGQPIEDYSIAFEQILRCAERATEESRDVGSVIVLSIPDWSVSPYAATLARESGRDLGRESDEIDEFNRVNRRIARARACYIDITGLSRQCTDADMFASDGLHPSSLQYALWMNKIQSVLDLH